VANARLLKALLDCHLSAAEILRAALRDAERAERHDLEEAFASGQAAARKQLIEDERSTIADGVEPDGFMTVSETMARLKVGRSTLYALIKQKKIAVVKIGRSSRFRRSDIASFVGPSEK